MSVRIGDRAPEFTLPAGGGKEVSLASLLAKGPLVLYFYPADDTPGCTREACSFRNSYEQFKDAGAEVVGVSSQSVASHEAFAEKNRLPFTLLADERGELRKRFGVPKALAVLPGRVTYVIDRGGVVRDVFDSALGFQKHAKRALEVLKGLADAPRSPRA